MRPVADLERQEELWIQLEAAVRVSIRLDHPARDAFWVELRVDGPIERVREIDPPAIAAHLDHLRSAVDRTRGRMRGTLDDAADAHRAGELRVMWIRHVVLMHLASAPAGGIEELVIE